MKERALEVKEVSSRRREMSWREKVLENGGIKLCQAGRCTAKCSEGPQKALERALTAYQARRVITEDVRVELARKMPARARVDHMK